MELLAPAGGAEAGYAALRYGADAVYLGLGSFSARAEAENFSPGALPEFAGYAHSLSPRRNVYLALNTLIKDDELSAMAETLFVAAECGVDAVIVQDPGVARLVRRRFPSLRLHASTQMAIHNADGVRAAEELGFSRVTLARELTAGEIERIVAAVPSMELEVFIHGALCYSYSGLCLFSSITTGRSGNRGRCAYPCREMCRSDGARGHAFSLKDLALGGKARDLAAMGVKSLKIEGRKKSPLYVAATTNYYRKLLDGRLDETEREKLESDLKTIFARPWTRLYHDSPGNPDVADPEVVGHRGAPAGTIRSIKETNGGRRLAFTPSVAVELHDGIQIDLPGESKPFGFPVDELYAEQNGRFQRVFAAAAGTRLEIPLPGDAPELRPGLPVYLASSQAVKRSYPYSVPKPGAFRPRLPLELTVRMARANENGGEGEAYSAEIACHAETAAPKTWGQTGGGEPIRIGVDKTFYVAAHVARDPAGTGQAARKAFERLGDSAFAPASFEFADASGLFVAPGEWNRLRRELVAEMESKLADIRRECLDDIRREAEAVPAGGRLLDAIDELKQGAASGRDASVVGPGFSSRRNVAAEETAALRSGRAPRWGLFVENPALLSAFTAEDVAAAAEITLGVEADSMPSLAAALARLDAEAAREKTRLATPLLFRLGREDALKETARELIRDGWRKWLCPGVGAWRMLRDVEPDNLDLAADWQLHALNRLAAAELFAMGFSSVTLSPEDDGANIKAMASRFGTNSRIVVYSDLPLFVSASCAHAALGLCRTGHRGWTGAACRAKEIDVRMDGGLDGTIRPAGCGTVLTGERPFSLLGHADALLAAGLSFFRVDLRWRPYEPAEAAGIWQRARSGMEFGISTTDGNFSRRLL